MDLAKGALYLNVNLKRSRTLDLQDDAPGSDTRCKYAKVTDGQDLCFLVGQFQSQNGELSDASPQQTASVGSFHDHRPTKCWNYNQDYLKNTPSNFIQCQNFLPNVSPSTNHLSNNGMVLGCTTESQMQLQATNMGSSYGQMKFSSPRFEAPKLSRPGEEGAVTDCPECAAGKPVCIPDLPFHTIS